MDSFPIVIDFSLRTFDNKHIFGYKGRLLSLPEFLLHYQKFGGN